MFLGVKGVFHYPTVSYGMPKIRRGFKLSDLKEDCGMKPFLDKLVRLVKFSENVHKVIDCKR